uniref:Zinc finger FYVE domain-containing protein 26 n=1 Tax=Cacopsylla melanoneura TaxID=428564 RepID=A0A8D8UUM0_9HEMI
MPETQFNFKNELEDNMDNHDTLCSTIANMKATELCKIQGKQLENIYKKSNLRKKLLIALASLVNKQKEIASHFKNIDLEELGSMHSRVTKTTETVVRRICLEDGQIETNELFIYMMLCQKHWVSIFTDQCCQLLLHDKQDLLQLVSSHSIVSYVWPAVLSILWEHHNTHPHSRSLSQEVIQRCSPLNPPLFSRIQEALHRVAKFEDWIHKMKDYERKSLECCHVLNMFSEHNILYIVNEYLNFTVDNFSEIRQYIVENTHSKCWQVALFDVYSTVYHVALLLIDPSRNQIDSNLQQILHGVNDAPHDMRLQISRSIVSLFFLTKNDLKQNDDNTITLSNNEVIGSESNETTDIISGLESNHSINDSFDKNNSFVLNNLDNLKTLTSTLTSYLTQHDGTLIPGSEIEQKTRELQTELNDINWKLAIIQRLSSKPPPQLSLGDHLYGRHKSAVEISKSDLERCNHEKVSEGHSNTDLGQAFIKGCPVKSKSHLDVSVTKRCPLNLILSSPEDFATYCVIKEDLEAAVSVVERYNLQDTDSGRQIISMNHYQSLYRTLSSTSPHDSCQVALQEMDKFNDIAQCSKLTILTDILCCVPMSCRQSEQLLRAIEKQYESCNANDLPNFSSLLSHLNAKHIELAQCISDDLVPPSTTLVDYLASGCSHMNLLFWQSLKRLSKEFTNASESKRLEEYFVMLVSVIKQSPYLDGIEEGIKPFSSRVQKMFFYLSSIDSLMSDCRGNLLNYVDQNLTSRIGQAVFIKNEPISSLDLPFVNLAYHLVNFCTGSIPLSIEPPCMKQVIVLNQFNHVTEPIPSWPRATHKTVTSLFAQLTDTFSPHDVITRDIAIKIAHSDWTKEVLEDTRLLQNMDTSRYGSGEDSTVFLINLYNLMWTHALLSLETSDTPLGLLSQSATCRHLTKRLVGYHLGSLGLVTLYHIESVLLANYAHVNSPFVDPAQLNEQPESARKDSALSVPMDTDPKPMDRDPRPVDRENERKLHPSVPMDSDLSLQRDNPLASWNVYRDPRIVFLLGNCYQLSPIVDEVSSFNWDTCLEQRMAQYAQAHIHLSHNVLHVPLLVFNYLDYVSSIQRPECEHGSSDTSSNQSRETRALLIEFVKEYTRVRSFILARKDVHVLDEVGFSINLSYSTQPNSSKSKTEDCVKIDTSIVLYVADHDLVLAGIVDNLSKTTPVVTSPSKHSKDKKGVLRSPPVVDHPLHNAYSRISDNLSKLCSRSHRVQLLSKMTPGISPLICFLNWTLVDQEVLWSCIEEEMSRGNFVLVLEMLYYVLTPRVFLEDVRWRQLYDSVLLELASSNDSVYILDVTSVPTMADFVLNNSRSSSLKCLQYLTARSHELDQDRAAKVDRQFFLSKINQEITETCGLTEWSVGDEIDPYEILKEIINNQDVDLAQRWCQYRNLPQEYKPNLEVLQQYAIFLLSTHNESLAETMCNALSGSDLRELCTRLINSDCDVTHVKVIVNQAMSRCEAQRGEDYERYIRTVIGVDILCLMNNEDQMLYRHLISHPYLIIEQLLLLTRLSLVDKILDHIKPYVISADTGTDKIPPGRLLQSEIDALLRTYATKALDFRICTTRGNMGAPSSVLSSCRPVDKSNFSPPRTPPSKDEWIPNDECTHCMVCQVTIFSMFNRRHHCRRCGRLVCGACSENRMKVSGYGGVSVRVCTQCHVYASPRTVTLEITTSSTSALDQQHPVFRVTTEDPNSSHPMEDFAYNATLRDEFSFDYAPSISLCLSILKFHTNNTTLAMYLCETCNALLNVMKPSNREIDHSFVIRMIKCLMLACKVIYDVHGVESVTLDEICSQVNLLSILVNNNCCHLMPDKPLVGMNALRQLRDSLLKEERWILALEVSTKAGLDYNSVWSVWGKACLKAGAWAEARNIFAKCHFDRRGESSTLIDILQILQTDTTSGDLTTRLSRLKQPPLPPTESASSYSECLYYLHTYGSVSLILTFLVHRDRLKEALDYVLDKRVSVDNFVEHVYFRCLKLGNTDSLFSLMEARDPSLLAWKLYLRAVCAHCERNSLLNSLYEIQLRTRDHVRSAITCVLFYLKHVHTYFQLNEKSYHLTNARTHLNDYRAQKTNNLLGMSMSSSELSKQLVLIHYQLKLIATILASNVEVANRYHVKLSTLFGGVEEKATLLLDVMLLGEEATGQQGEERKYRNLVRETVSALGLNPVPLYSELVKLLARQSRVQDIRDLILCLKPDLGASCDDILMGAIRFKPPLVEHLISLVSKIPLQISLFTETGKLKSAYLLAVKHNRLGDIRLIAQQAKRLDQSAILNICLKKIEFEESKMRRERLTSGEQNSKTPTSKMRDTRNQDGTEEKSKTLSPSPGAPSEGSRTIIRSRNPALQYGISIDQDNQPRKNSRLADSSIHSQLGQDRTRRSTTTSQSVNQSKPSTSSQSSDSSFSEIAAVLRAYEQQRTPSNQSIRSSGKSSSDSRVKHTPTNRPLKQGSIVSTPETPPSPFSDIASVLRAYEQKRLKNSRPSSQESLAGSSSKSSQSRIQGTPESGSKTSQSSQRKDPRSLQASSSKSKILTSPPGNTRSPKSKSSSDNNQS